MKRKLISLLFATVIALLLFVRLDAFTDVDAVASNEDADLDGALWHPLIAESVNKKPIFLTVDNREIKWMDAQLYMDEDMNLMMPVSSLTDSFRCAVNLYDKERLVVKKDTIELQFELNKQEMLVNQTAVPVPAAMVRQADEYYVDTASLAEGLHYDYHWDTKENRAILTSENPNARIVPYTYDYREMGRKPAVKDQGKYGTCWAFAALTALESTLLPEEQQEFSPDHMSLHNSFQGDQNTGGEYTMAMAYLTGWQGPVREADDPYGDGVSPEGLEAVKHVQEIQVIEGKDFERIKEAVFCYGGVQSSLYTSLTGALSRSMHYNQDTKGYCYIGTEKPNHDVVIIGWDDNYSKENFNSQPEGNGAFICQNSWGSQFGDDGVFYVSYYDTNIGMHNVVYTKVENTDNYDRLYQSDLCGWVGQVGYGTDTAYFANVYQTAGREQLRAVGFYATDKETKYEIYAVKNVEGPDSLNQREFLQSGYLENAGFYTIALGQPVILEAGERFAVLIKIQTPNSIHPIAIEYAADASTEQVDLTDGEGYISLYGYQWDALEENYECNFCLKAYTDTIE